MVDFTADGNNVLYSDKLTICGLNVCGLHGKYNHGLLSEFMQDFDVFGMCETKCQDVPVIEGYTSFVKKKSSPNCRLGGYHGICVYIKSSLSAFCAEVGNTSFEGALWVKFDIENCSFILGVVYMPGENSEHHKNNDYEVLESDLANLTQEFELPFILVGDFNSRTRDLPDWLPRDVHGDVDVDQSDDDDDTPLRSNCDIGVNQNGKNLLSLCQAATLVICNGRFGSDAAVGAFTCRTSRGASVVDYAILSKDLIPSIMGFKVDTFDATLSDVHSPIILSMRIHALPTTENNAVIVEPEQTGPSLSYTVKWRPEARHAYMEGFDVQNVNSLIRKIDDFRRDDPSQGDIDQLYGEFSALLVDSAVRAGVARQRPKKRRTYRKPKLDSKAWFDSECRLSRQEYRRMKARLKISPSLESAAVLKARAKQYKRLTKTKMKEFHRDLSRRLRELASADPKEYWKIINNAGNSNVDSKDEPSATEFFEHFKKLSEEQLAPPLLIPLPDVDLECTSMMNDVFTKVEIAGIMKNLKNNKAHGTDSIPNEFLKNCPDSILELLTKFFNLVLDSGIVPEDWCLGLIKPLYKNKGSRQSTDNYRGITILSCVGKLFTGCLHERLSKFLESNAKIGEEQAGFRPGYSTADHILSLSLIINFYLQRRERLYCCFIDYRKAFDFVDRTALWVKMLQSGIDGKIMRVIQYLYLKAKSSVKNDRESSFSVPFQCNNGIRQGENLSPLLFAIFLSDFEPFIRRHFPGLETLNGKSRESLVTEDFEEFLELYLLLYADDTVVLSESILGLQKALDAVAEYCGQWNLFVNVDKTKVIVFSRGKIRNLPNLQFNGIKLEVVDNFMYLGVTFMYNGRFKNCIKDRIARAKRAVFKLKAKARKLQLPLDLTIDCFKKAVLPVALYGCEVWACENTEPLSIFVRNFLRSLLKLPHDSARVIVDNETGMYSAEERINSRILNYWFRMVNGKSSKIVFLLYRLSLNLIRTEHFKCDWITYVKKLLLDLGMIHIWKEQGNPRISADVFREMVKTRMSEQYQLWRTLELETNLKCTFYRLLGIKSKGFVQDYMRILDYKFVVPLARFRCRSNNLPINQWLRNPLRAEEFPICELCQRLEIADEFHYVFNCDFFRQKRLEMIQTRFRMRPNILRLRQLFSCKNVSVLKSLSNFASVVMGHFDA